MNETGLSSTVADGIIAGEEWAITQALMYCYPKVRKRVEMFLISAGDKYDLESAEDVVNMVLFDLANGLKNDFEKFYQGFRKLI